MDKSKNSTKNMTNDKKTNSDSYIRLTTDYDGMTVCNIFPARNDPDRVEDFKKSVANLVFESVKSVNGKE